MWIQLPIRDFKYQKHYFSTLKWKLKFGQTWETGDGSLTVSSLCSASTAAIAACCWAAASAAAAAACLACSPLKYPFLIYSTQTYFHKMSLPKEVCNGHDARFSTPSLLLFATLLCGCLAFAFGSSLGRSDFAFVTGSSTVKLKYIHKFSWKCLLMGDLLLFLRWVG